MPKKELSDERSKTGRLHETRKHPKRAQQEQSRKESPVGGKEERKGKRNADGGRDSHPKSQRVLKPPVGFQGKCVFNPTGEPHGERK